MPVPSRTVTAPCNPATTATLTLNWAPRSPGDVSTYYLDCTALMAEDGDSVSSFSAEVTGNDDALTIEQQPVDGSVLGMRLSGGTSGIQYTVMVSVYTAGEDTFVFNLNSLCMPVGLVQALPAIAIGPAGAPAVITLSAVTAGIGYEPVSPVVLADTSESLVTMISDTASGASSSLAVATQTLGTLIATVSASTASALTTVSNSAATAIDGLGQALGSVQVSVTTVSATLSATLASSSTSLVAMIGEVAASSSASTASLTASITSVATTGQNALQAVQQALTGSIEDVSSSLSVSIATVSASSSAAITTTVAGLSLGTMSHQYADSVDILGGQASFSTLAVAGEDVAGALGSLSTGIMSSSSAGSVALQAATTALTTAITTVSATAAGAAASASSLATSFGTLSSTVSGHTTALVAIAAAGYATTAAVGTSVTTAIAALSLGNMSQQNATNVNITGGSAQFDAFSSYAGIELGSSAGSTLALGAFAGLTTNFCELYVALVRRNTGSDWTSAIVRLGAMTDETPQAAVDYNATPGGIGISTSGVYALSIDAYQNVIFPVSGSTVTFSGNTVHQGSTTFGGSGAIGQATWSNGVPYASLPTSAAPGTVVFCTNARVATQAPSAGTGSLVQYSPGYGWCMLGGQAVTI